MDESLSQWNVRDALKRFCFEARIKDVNNCEPYFRSQQLAHFGYPNLGGASNRGEPERSEPFTIEQLQLALEAAWTSLLLDLQLRIERGDLNISGVQTEPELKDIREKIPNQWAMDFRIQPLQSVVVLKQFRYVNVLIRPSEMTDRSIASGTFPAVRTIDAESAADLNDETLLALLEEHARRVIASPHARLIQPGKISLLPIVRGKMRHRSRNGELLPTLGAECRWLAGWIAEKVNFHQVPTASTIGKVLGPEYWQLKPRSKTAIQNSIG